jgi:hypothetical protein
MNTRRFIILAVIWSAAAYLILQLHNLTFQHAFCLPDRCGPPAGALLSVHLFWLLVLLTAVVVARWSKPDWPWKRVGSWLCVLAVVAIVVIIGRELSTFGTPPEHATSISYYFRRLLFPIITLSDVPLIQLLLAGLALMIPLRAAEKTYTAKDDAGGHEDSSDQIATSTDPQDAA